MTPAKTNLQWQRRANRMTGIGPTLILALFLAVNVPRLCAQLLLDEETEQLLIDAVVAAAELDLYNARCRSDVSGRSTDNLNKELVGRFHMTVLDVEDGLFPERSYQRATERMQREFLAKLKELGGCKKAKKAGIPTQLREHYDDLMQELNP